MVMILLFMLLVLIILLELLLELLQEMILELFRELRLGMTIYCMELNLYLLAWNAAPSTPLGNALGNDAENETWAGNPGVPVNYDDAWNAFGNDPDNAGIAAPTAYGYTETGAYGNAGNPGSTTGASGKTVKNNAPSNKNNAPSNADS